MDTNQSIVCRRQDHVRAAYVNAALTIAQFSVRRAENMMLSVGVSREVITRTLLIGQPIRHRKAASLI